MKVGVEKIFNQIVEPFFFDYGSINGARYLELLQDPVWHAIADRPDRHDVFLQDGAPPYYALPVRTFLDEHFKGRWIDRRGPIEWPPMSPDFSLWGFMKDQVYAEKPRTIQELKQWITEMIAAVNLNM